MNIFQKALETIREYRAKSEVLVEVDERGGISEYPENVEIRNW